jgi:hypothetical protein
MKTLTPRILAVWLFVVITGAVQAHHSNTPFDMSRTLHATGVVEKADFRNPHSLLTLVITDAGTSSSVTFEGHSLATLRHYGLGPSMVKAGDEISISYAPRRDGKPGGIFLSVSLANGDTLDFSQLGYD